jgi:hypothetical protein
VTVRVGGRHLTIRTTSEAFGGWLAETVATDAIEGTEPDRVAYSIVVGEQSAVGRPVHVVYRGGSEILRATDLTRIATCILGELDTYGLGDRDDALHLAGSLVFVDGRAVLGPAFLHPVLGRMGRRALRAGIVWAPAAALSIDLSSGAASPPSLGLSIPPRALERLVGLMPDVAGEPEPWAIDPSRVKAIVLFGSDPIEPPAPTRAETLRELAERSLNLHKVGGRGLVALGRFVEDATCSRSGWVGGDGWLHVLRAAARGDERPGRGRSRPARRYAIRGSEDTPPAR